MTITLAEAEKLLQAAKAKAREMGIPVSIAVVDPRGDLVAVARQDGARWTTPEIARGKAVASATFGVPSGELAERANSPVMRSVMLMQGGRFIPHQGALPIKRSNQVIGAVGVSGGTSQQDEEVAQAGIDAL
ncbi:MAG: heme-binding protein [Dehalococcoidia bacterium]